MRRLVGWARASMRRVFQEAGAPPPSPRAEGKGGRGGAEAPPLRGLAGPRAAGAGGAMMDVNARRRSAGKGSRPASVSGAF